MTLALIESGGRILGMDVRSAAAKSRRYGHRFVGLLGVDVPDGPCPGCDRPTNNADGFCSFCDHVAGEAAADALAECVSDNE